MMKKMKLKTDMKILRSRIKYESLLEEVLVTRADLQKLQPMEGNLNFKKKTRLKWHTVAIFQIWQSWTILDSHGPSWTIMDHG